MTLDYCYLFTITAMVLGMLRAGVLGATCPPPCACAGASVDCSHRGLTSVPADLPPSTQQLYLRNNSISSIPVDLTSSLPQLQVLDLQGNQITRVPVTTFQDLAGIRALDLSYNLLTEIPSRAFQKTSAHKACRDASCFVDVRHNPVRTIRRYAFAWMRGLAVYIGESRMELAIHSHAFYGLNGVPLVQLSGVKELNLDNSLFIAPNISNIEFKDSNIPVLKSYSFKDTRNVRRIRFVDCIITDVEKGAFSGIVYAAGNSSSLTELQFTGCSLSVLPSEAFTDTNLESVSITNSNIRELEPNIFWGMSNLQAVDIINSSFPNISSRVFSGLSHVHKILLHNNKMSSVESNAFSESMHISHISIRQSPGTSLHVKNDAFRDLSQVGTLHIDAVNMLDLAPSAFSGLVDVETLRFSRVTIPLLRAHAFSGLTRVGHLHARDVRIAGLEGYEALRPMATGTSITRVSLEGVSLPCNCPSMLAYPRAMELFTNNNVTCLDQQTNRTMLDGGLITAMQDECRPPHVGGAASTVHPASFLFPSTVCFILCMASFIPR